MRTVRNEFGALISRTMLTTPLDQLPLDQLPLDIAADIFAVSFADEMLADVRHSMHDRRISPSEVDYPLG